jgi:hypothetical protein
LFFSSPPFFNRFSFFFPSAFFSTFLVLFSRIHSRAEPESRRPFEEKEKKPAGPPLFFWSVRRPGKKEWRKRNQGAAERGEGRENVQNKKNEKNDDSEMRKNRK